MSKRSPTPPTDRALLVIGNVVTGLSNETRGRIEELTTYDTVDVKWSDVTVDVYGPNEDDKKDDDETKVEARVVSGYTDMRQCCVSMVLIVSTDDDATFRNLRKWLDHATLSMTYSIFVDTLRIQEHHHIDVNHITLNLTGDGEGHDVQHVIDPVKL